MPVPSAQESICVPVSPASQLGGCQQVDAPGQGADGGVRFSTEVCLGKQVHIHQLGIAN